MTLGGNSAERGELSALLRCNQGSRSDLRRNAGMPAAQTSAGWRPVRPAGVSGRRRTASSGRHAAGKGASLAFEVHAPATDRRIRRPSAANRQRLPRLRPSVTRWRHLSGAREAFAFGWGAIPATNGRACGGPAAVLRRETDGERNSIHSLVECRIGWPPAIGCHAAWYKIDPRGVTPPWQDARSPVLRRT